MKTPSLLFTAWTFALLAATAGAQAPGTTTVVPAPEAPPSASLPPPPQIEIDSKFFTIGREAAVRLGLLPGEGGSSPLTGGPLGSVDLQKLVVSLEGEKSVKRLAAPRVTTKSGQRAVIEIIREFRYPTEFEADQVGPVTPTKFETRNMGVTVEIEPVLAEGGFIEIEARPSLTAFHRFANYAGGKTQAAGPIPRDGFAQPIFDNVQSSVSAVLRSEQSLVLGGFEWHGSKDIAFDQRWATPADQPEVTPAGDPKLLFMTLTARLVQPPVAAGGGKIKAGSPVIVSAQLAAVARERLPEWMNPKVYRSVADAWTDIGLAEPGEGEELRKALEGAPEKAISAKAMSELWTNLTGVLNPEQTRSVRQTLESASGGAISTGPEKTLAAKERYLVEASGSLYYPAPAKAGAGVDGKGTPKPSGAGGAPAGGIVERVDLQLAVRAECGDGGTIDLEIVPNLVTALQRGDGPEAGARSGGVSAEWKSLDREPVWSKKTGTVAVTVWSGSTAMFVRASEGRPDQLQILLITARGIEAENGAGGGKPNASEPAKPPVPEVKDALLRVWPVATAVPGKPGFVISPHAPEKGYVDVRGFPAGTEVQCPYTRKTFLVP